MSAKHPAGRDEEKAEEARHVAEDAIEAAEQGDAEEAAFLAGEAKSLDKEAAEEVLADMDLGNKSAKP